MNGNDIVRLSSSPNAAVVQLPERKHPGVVVQGDSLQNLDALLDSAEQELEQGNVAEARETIAELRDILHGYLESYHRATSLVERH